MATTPTRHHATPEKGRRAAIEFAWVPFAVIAGGLALTPVLWGRQTSSTGWHILAGGAAARALTAWFFGRWAAFRAVRAADYRLCLRCRGPLEMLGDSGRCTRCDREYSRVTLVWCWSNTYALGERTGEGDVWPDD